MASKLFMGDMPELMENILNNLENEFPSLYSCTLVSRHWCKMSIPILWQDPFSFDRKPSFISNYFSSLDDDEDSILKDYGINPEFSKTLFNYARFLKVLDLYRLEKMTKKWSEIFCLLGQNVQFFSQLQYLSLGTISVFSDFIIDDAIALLKILAKRSTKIS
ncbi:2887_t:CDS:2, partial [Cetraspora pellucida]